VKLRVAKRTHVPLGGAKFHVNRCNESPLWGENADFWPVIKFDTGSLPHRGILLVKQHTKITNTIIYDLPQTLHGDRARCMECFARSTTNDDA